jgi:Glycosyltransferase family 87
VLALALLILFGVVGVGRGGARALVDFDYFYAAGRCWLAGSSMYDPVAFSRELQALGVQAEDLSFPYSPAFAPLGIAFAALPYSAASFAIWALNLAGVALLCLVAIRLARPANAEPRAGTTWLLVCAVAGLPCTANVLWLGQLTVWMAALTCAAWSALRERRALLAGLLLGLTSIKPQFSLFLVLWLALQREWRVLGVAGLTALALCGYSMVVLGPLEPFRLFLEGLGRYASDRLDADMLGNVHVVGLPSLLAAAGVSGLDVLPFVLCGCLAVVALWFARRRLREEGVLALLLAGQIALVYAHDIEFVFLAPVWAWLWVRYEPGSRWSWASLALLLLLSLPKRLVTSDTSGMLLQWRSFGMLLLLALVVASVARRASSASAPSAASPARRADSRAAPRALPGSRPR